MKLIVATIALILLSFVPACKQRQDNRTAAGAPDGKDSGKAIRSDQGRSSGPVFFARNIQIGPLNAYSDLLLDSGAMESFAKEQKFSDTLTRQFRNFYNVRNFQYAWFASDGLSEQALAFSSLYNYSKDSSTPRKWLDEKLDSLMNQDSLTVTAADPGMVRTELLMTWRFINYLGNRYTAEKDRTTALVHMVPSRKVSPMEMADSTLAGDPQIDSTANPWYPIELQYLKTYIGLAQKGPWEKLRASRVKIKMGDEAALVTAIKRRLHLTGEIANPSDTTARADTNFVHSIRGYQEAHGLEPDGKIGPALLEELNIPPDERIKKILMNLERMKWMPTDRKGRLILVNIPEFRLHVLENDRPAFDMNVVVGKEGHSTVLFSGNLDRISFNPYWNIPAGIVKKEILPAMKKHKHYLQEHQMEITGHRNGLPVIRQLPGSKNELGKMKFLFPNRFDIYFHDSPHKELFNLAQRAYSHGCIRLADARKMAGYLLAGMQDWNAEKLDRVLTGKKEQTVILQQPVPVLIYYFTAWPGEGKIQEFRKDVYGHDDRLAGKLFLNGGQHPVAGNAAH